MVGAYLYGCTGKVGEAADCMACKRLAASRNQSLARRLLSRERNLVRNLLLLSRTRTLQLCDERFASRGIGDSLLPPVYSLQHLAPSTPAQTAPSELHFFP